MKKLALSQHSDKISYKRFLELALIETIPFIVFIAFSSLSLYWVTSPYDAWRIYEIIILMAFSIYLLFLQRSTFSVFNLKTNSTIRFILIITFLLLSISCYSTSFSERSIADASLYCLLVCGIYAQAHIFRKFPSLAPKIAALLATFPILTLIFLPIAIYDRLNGSEGIWSQSFSNIRMLDDALLPCLFLLWQRPAWLSKHLNKSNYFNNVLSGIVFSLSVIYILSFLLHGARAALLALSMSLLFLFLDNRHKYRQLLLPISSFITASIIFSILSYFQVSTADGSTLIRTGTSERIEIWKKSLNLWLESPILGNGGNSFVLSAPYMNQAHPHNIVLQLLSEWGLGGLLSIFLLCPLLVIIFRERQKLPNFALASLISLAVNAMLSGTLIYPISQITALWPMAWIISLLPIHKHYTQNNGSFFDNNLLVIFKIIALISILSMLYVHGKDIFCYACASIDPIGAPRFWDAGRANHLTTPLQ